MTVRILGIDPGSRRTGWAMIGQSGRQLSVIESGVIRLAERDALGARLGGLLEALETLVEGTAPNEVAIEDIFAAKNARSALALGQARGVALAVAGRRRLPIHAYPPATVKRAVCGHGRAEKEQVQRMVTALLVLREPPLEDEADAMAIAICHALMRRAPSLAALATTGGPRRIHSAGGEGRQGLPSSEEPRRIHSGEGRQGPPSSEER